MEKQEITVEEAKIVMEGEGMLFPYRWFDSLGELSADEFKEMLTAICEYAEFRDEPKFKGALAALWKEYKHEIDDCYAKCLSINQEAGK